MACATISIIALAGIFFAFINEEPTTGSQNTSQAPPFDAWAPADGSDPTDTGGMTNLESALIQARSGEALTNGDLAYCSDGGRVVQVGATRTYRGALCDYGGRLRYHGLTKTNEERITLPARIEGDVVVAASDGGYSYHMAEDALSIKKNSTTVKKEQMSFWWPRGHAELDLPGDLNISQPISYPKCDGTISVIVDSAFDPDTDASRVQELLTTHPGSKYLRTDLSCDNFRGPSTQNSGNNYIYAVYYTMNPSQETEACMLAQKFDGYADWMRNDVDPHDQINCG